MRDIVENLSPNRQFSRADNLTVIEISPRLTVVARVTKISEL